MYMDFILSNVFIVNIKNNEIELSDSVTLNSSCLFSRCRNILFTH